MDVRNKFIEAGYTDEGRTPYGERYRRDGYTVYHSGYYLIFIRKGGMTRPFNVDRLLYFSVQDLEKQTGIKPRPFDGKEDITSYDYGRKF